MVYTDSDQLNGCYASHIRLRSGTALFPIPENLSNATVAPANCALATMVNAVEQISTAHGQTGIKAHPQVALVQV